MEMPPVFTTILLAFLASLLVLPVYSSDEKDDPAAKKYKFLYFASITGASHYSLVSMSGKALVQRGHQVVSLMSSSNPDTWKRDADFFSFLVFNSSYTKQNRTDVMHSMSKVAAKGHLNSFWGQLVTEARAHLTGELSMLDMWLHECDDLLGDSATMKRLREEKFDMLVADDAIPCSPLLAQALDIPFTLISVPFAVPSKHGYWTGLPTDPSCIPERVLGLTDRMTFFQRVKNVLAHIYYRFFHHPIGIYNFGGYDELKVKYGIKPEISTVDSYKQALLYLFHGSLGLEFPRPMQPNTVYVLHSAGIHSNQTIEEDIVKFLDTAPAGVVLFSLGTWVYSVEREQVQMFADGFTMLPHQVLWQTTLDLTGITLGSNTKVAKWLPWAQIMEHKNVKAYVGQGGGLTVYEALWAGLPIVGLPLFEDQMDNMVHVEDRGAGISLDITSLRPDTFSKAISRVMMEPKFLENAQRLSRIIRDIQTTSPPVDTAAHWILHVTKFGGDHLRPAVQDMNFLQSSLLDVYLFLSVVLTLIIAINASAWYVCCKCMCPKGWKSHPKED